MENKNKFIAGPKPTLMDQVRQILRYLHQACRVGQQVNAINLKSEGKAGAALVNDLPEISDPALFFR